MLRCLIIRKSLRHALKNTILAASMMGAVISNAFAAQEGVSFGITVGQRHYCQIVLTQDGTLASDAAGTELSSKMPGGTSATAEITTTRASYSVSLDAPTTFSTMPAGGDTGVSFSTTYSMTGDTNEPEAPGTSVRKAKRGLTFVNMDLVATRTGSLYPAGNYSGIAVLRCE